MPTDPVQNALAQLSQGRFPEGLAALQAGADAGDAPALAELAAWSLRGEVVPRDLHAARRYLRAAVEIGHVDAALTEVALTANGTGGASDWRAAMNLLRRAAAQDYVAQQQLSLLGEMALTADGYPANLPSAVTLSRQPSILRFAELFSAAECEHLARASVTSLAPALVSDPATGRMIAHPIRTSHSAVIGPTNEDLVVQAILRRIAVATGTGVPQGEPLNVLRYTPGQEYRLHSDALTGVKNQRVKTALIYLNDGFVGGATAFPTLGLSVAPSAGDLLVFTNTLPDGTPDPNARHAGLPVTNGTKWLATRWIREQPYDVWNPD